MISHIALAWLLLAMAVGVSGAIPEVEESDTYIIHMDHSQKPETFPTHESWHKFTIKSLSTPTGMLMYSYNHVMHGFSARLTPSQVSELEKSPAHVATDKESFGKLFTTYTTKFLGLNSRSGLLPAAWNGKDVIIGLIDTGIWPESESFNDKGMGPVPKTWKGRCDQLSCNRKLIGARSFSKGHRVAGVRIERKCDLDSPRDYIGHGTHTSSTAAGSHVPGVSHLGYGRGTARGVAPAARVAMYKVTDTTGDVAVTDVLAAMDQAVADGVHVLSLSLGFAQTPYFKDQIAIGSLSAIEKGIVVICAAGNDGGLNTTHNGAPWITTVGAGTIDRRFTATMTLPNGWTAQGTSYFPQSIYITNTTLYHGKQSFKKSTCAYNTLKPHEVAGKIVLCDNSSKSSTMEQMSEVQRAGAYAAILLTDTRSTNLEDFSFPIMTLQTGAGAVVRDYIQRVSNASVKTMSFVSTKLGITPAPQVASFSSRGPDPISPGVLKPDILAPGVDVIAAVPPMPFMEVGNYHLQTDYRLMSGTSMATPHVAGVAALLKAVHDDWSPAAIRSAIMTTSYKIDNTGSTITDQETGQPATPLEFGAGHINPNKAMDPGLIYDMVPQDYIEFLCNLKYTKKQMRAVLRRNKWSCSHKPFNLNYPSFVVIRTKGEGSSVVKTFSRTVTNVGDDIATYKAILEVPDGMIAKTEPSMLRFTHKYQKQDFVLSIQIDKNAPQAIYGYLKWVDEHIHVVSSPIVAISG